MPTAFRDRINQRRTLLFECRGDLNVFEENLSACHAVARLFGVRTKHIKACHPEQATKLRVELLDLRTIV